MPCTVLCLGAFLITTSCVHRSTFTMTFIKINKLEKSDNKNFVLLKAINSDFKKRKTGIVLTAHIMIHIRSCASCKSDIAASRLETHGHRQKSPISFACTFCSFTNSLDFYCSHELFMLCSDWCLQTFMTHASIKTTLSRHDD